MKLNVYPDKQWDIARLGKFTASQIDDLLTPPKDKAAKDRGELSDTAKKYIKQKATEIITGTIRQIQVYATEWGNEWESKAAEKLRSLYAGEFEYYGSENPMFFPYCDFSGGSPDAVDRFNAVVFEIKCPENPENHIEYCLLESGQDLKKVNRAYYHQIQFNMLCVAKELKCDFMDMSAIYFSYYPYVREGYKDEVKINIYPEKGFKELVETAIDKGTTELARILGLMQTPQVITAEYDSNVGATIIQS